MKPPNISLNGVATQLMRITDANMHNVLKSVYPLI